MVARTAVVVVVFGTVVDVDAGVAGGGALAFTGSGALAPPMTYTGVPYDTVLKNQSEEFIGIRTHPCEAG